MAAQVGPAHPAGVVDAGERALDVLTTPGASNLGLHIDNEYLLVS